MQAAKCAEERNNFWYQHTGALDEIQLTALDHECTAGRFAKLVIANYRGLHGATGRSRSSSCAQRVRQEEEFYRLPSGN